MGDEMIRRLTIGIVTYNRAQYLAELLESIAKEIGGNPQEQVEVVVSDNASTDNTADVVKKYCQLNSSIKYYRNSTNFGFDRNLLQVVEKATGDYVWLMGDDDLVLPGSVGRVLAALGKNINLDVILGDKSDFFLTADRPFFLSSVFSFKNDRVFDFKLEEVGEYFKVAKKLICFFNFISILVVKREKWLRVKNFEKFIESGYIHCYLVMSMLFAGEKGKLLCLNRKITARRWGEDRIVGVFNRLKSDANSYHDISQSVFTDKKYVRALEGLLIKNDLFSWTVRAKIVGGVDFYLHTFPFLLIRYWNYILFWLKIFPLLFMPATLLKIMRWTYRKAVKGEPLGFKEIFCG